MIQRIQTVFLFLTGVCMLLFIISPVWVNADSSTGELYRISALCLVHELPGGSETTYTYIPYGISGILAFFSIIIALFEIFKYKNRLTQIKLGTLNSLLMTISLALIAYLCYTGQQDFLPGMHGKFKAGLFMPAAALIFNSLANRFIHKDEKLIRSVERIR